MRGQIPVYTVKIPNYTVDAEPDHRAIGEVVDDALRQHCMGQMVGLRGLGSQEHPGKTVDELVKIIRRDGTDRYDPARTGDRYDNVEGKRIDLFLLRRKVTPKAQMFWQLSHSFYHYPSKMHGRPVRVDILVIYDLAQLKAVRTTHTHEGYPVTKRDGYVFRDPASKPAAVLGILKIEQ